MSFSRERRIAAWTVWTAVLVLSGPMILSQANGDGRHPVANHREPETPVVNSSRVQVAFETAPGSPPVKKAELWFTTNDGHSWQRAAGPTSPKSPLIFDPESDGIYGFYIVLFNEAGSSSAPPKAGTLPQQVMRVDRTAPSVQILSVRPDPRFEVNRDVEIRWRVDDDDLPNRPVALHYRCEQRRSYMLIADRQATASSLRWTVPAGISGRIEVQASAADRAGNVGRSVFDGLHIKGNQAVMEPPSAATRSLPSDLVKKAGRQSGDAVRPVISLSIGEPDAPTVAGPDGAAQEARKRYDQGTWHRLRGETAQAMARFGEALRLDPTMSVARTDLAGLMILQGRLDEAEKELHQVLMREPEHRGALKSLAVLQAARKNYRSSSVTLQKYLLLEPKDAEAWVSYGDVTLFMGDRPGAREAWQRAASLEDASDDLKQRVKNRLAMQDTEHLAAGPAEETEPASQP